MPLSALGIAYRNMHAALSPLVGGRVQPFSEAEGVTEPHIRVWVDSGGADKQSAGQRNYAYLMNVVATDTKKDVVLTLMEGISQALDERGTQDERYDDSGEFAPKSDDTYAVFNITEGRSLDGHFFEEDKATRHATNGAQYEVRVGEV